MHAPVCEVRWMLFAFHRSRYVCSVQGKNPATPSTADVVASHVQVCLQRNKQPLIGRRSNREPVRTRDARRSLLFSWTPHFAVAMTNFPRIPLGGSRSPTLREEEIKRRCDGIYIFVDLL
ncbi:uncharacterized protein LOC112213588 isoform X1 [Bombus impatiens]|uniref:Uncharacterized protein LOC112213588 isoform X1 n=1 Tax=Bombus impatiens TaxID=132113 RepID=A0A6P8M125_BOMIM|nr:uncharacterized protein LOC112213588 isoform X1 [Bombus impatiens]XP_033179021.1 uncharacterized protein LOC112213588 isoform X1 [Bombus impatiens]XP_033179022.1 uncharacterized protein LOC112213588 isoform X1 [Bombus impatiens]